MLYTKIQPEKRDIKVDSYGHGLATQECQKVDGEMRENKQALCVGSGVEARVRRVLTLQEQ